MKFLVLLTESVLPIFIILGIANVYYRKFQPDIRQLVNISLYIFAPSVVFSSMIKEHIGFFELGRYILLMIIMTAILMAIGRLAGFLLRLDSDDSRLFMLSVSMINIGNFGVPLIYFTYGQPSINYSILTFISFNIPLVTIAIYLSSGEKNIKNNLKNVLSIPIFHASLLALLLNTFHVPVPATIIKLTEFLGSAAFPLFIFVLGLQLTTIKLNRGLIKAALSSVALRLGVSPFISAGVLSLMSFQGLAYSVTLVQISGPTALLPLMYAIKFGKKSDLLAAVILLSTAVSAITLPIVIYFAS